MDGTGTSINFPPWVPLPAILIATLSRRVFTISCGALLGVVAVAAIVKGMLADGLAKCSGFLGQIATSLSPELSEKCSLARGGDLAATWLLWLALLPLLVVVLIRGVLTAHQRGIVDLARIGKGL